MRAQPGWILLAVAATMMGKLVVHAQDWETVDDFTLAGGHAEARGVAVDAAGRIYVVGTANGHAIVRYSADGGSSWITRDDFLYPSETNNLFNAITVDRRGALFVGGASGGHWIIRRSTDHGVRWKTVDDFFRPYNGPNDPGTNGTVYSLSSDEHGRVYGVGGLHIPGPTYNYWWVRGSRVGGTKWDTKLVMFSFYGSVAQTTCAGEDVYVTGSIEGDPAIGLILRSSDHGATWGAVFEATNDFHDAITSDFAGNLYSAGNSSTSTSVDWLVRKATPGRTNWTTLDRSSYEGSSEFGVDQPDPRSIAIDAAGNICVTGQFLDYYVLYGTNSTTYGANWTWFTRQYSAATGEWSTTDLFSYSTNMQGVAMGTAIAGDGSTFVVGYGTSDSGQRRWVVRKRAPLIAAPR